MKFASYRFEDFLLDAKTRKLFNHHKMIQLSTRAYDVLHYLVKNQGRVVEKKELLDNVWSDSFVEEGNLPVYITSLRKILGEKKGEKKFIETIVGKGYCFVSSVKIEESEDETDSSDEHSELTEMTADNLGNIKRLDIETQRMYLKARYIIESKFSLQKSKEVLLQAIQLLYQVVQNAPDFAPAYSSLANSYFLMHDYFFLPSSESITKAKTYIKVAFSLDKYSSETYFVNGVIELHFDRNWKKAEDSLIKSLNLDAKNIAAYNELSLLSLFFGRFDEAVNYQQQALSFSPVSFHHLMGLCRIYFFSRQFNKSLSQAKELLEMDSRLFIPLLFSSLSYAHLSKFEEAFSSIEKMLNVNNSTETQLVKSYIYALSGRTDEARRILDKVLARTSSEIADMYDIAVVYAGLREKESAFEFLEKAFESDSVHIGLLKVDPQLDFIRDDSRYDSLLKRLNLE